MQPVAILVLFPRARESIQFIKIPGDCIGRHVWNTSTPILRFIRGVLWPALLPGLSGTVDILGGPGDPCTFDIRFVNVNEAGGRSSFIRSSALEYGNRADDSR
jgi:hypothetical protein